MIWSGTFGSGAWISCLGVGRFVEAVGKTALVAAGRPSDTRGIPRTEAHTLAFESRSTAQSLPQSGTGHDELCWRKTIW